MQGQTKLLEFFLDFVQKLLRIHATLAVRVGRYVELTIHTHSTLRCQMSMLIWGRPAAAANLAAVLHQKRTCAAQPALSSVGLTSLHTIFGVLHH